MLLLVVCFTLALTGCGGGDKKTDAPKDGGKKEKNSRC